MNVRPSARVAHLYRQSLRRRGANLAIDAINAALDGGISTAAGTAGRELVAVGQAAQQARVGWFRRASRFENRLYVAKDARLAHAGAQRA